MRLDKFLKVSRVIKRRTVANEACDNGRVSVNGKTAKAGTAVKVGDIVSVSFAGGNTEFEVLSTEENVKKEGAKEMYRIITSLIVAFFISLTALGLSSCGLPGENAPAGESYVGTIAGQKVYDEQYGYIFLNTAKEEAGDELSEDWIEEHKAEIIEKTNDKCREMCSLYYEAENGSRGYTRSDKEKIYSDTDARIRSYRSMKENKSIESDDEMCALLTGMNVNEYKRFAVFRGEVERESAYIASFAEPTDEELINCLKENKDDFRSITYIYKKLFDEEENSNEEDAEEILEIAKSGQFSFDMCAKGWSDSKDVKKDGGVVVIQRNSTEFPAQIVKWAFESSEATDQKDAVLITTDNGYYIVIRNVLPELKNSEALREKVLTLYTAKEIRNTAEKTYSENSLKTEGFEDEKTIKAADEYIRAFIDKDFDFEEPAETTPEPTEPPYSHLSFEEADETSFGKIGDTEMKAYCLANIFRAKLDELVKEEEDYNEDLTLGEFIEIRNRILAEHKDELTQAAVAETERLYMAYSEYEKRDDANVTEASKKAIEDGKKYLSLTYFEALNDKYDGIETPDDAMRFMCGTNAESAVQYEIIRKYATEFISKYMYEMTIDAGIVEDFYKENENRFRRVDLAIAVASDLKTAETIKEEMEKNPKYAANIANALREEDNIERHGGIVRITASIKNIPGAIREWAYSRTPELTITENGKAEIIEGSGKYYVIACIDIQEFEDELENTVYTETAAAYKKEEIEKYFTELEKTDEYKITELDEERISEIIDGCIA